MRTSTITLSALALVAGLAACSAEEPANPAAPRSELAPAGPGSGAVIIETPVAAFAVHLDAERGLLSVHAPSDVCQSGNVNVAQARFIITPSEIDQFLAQLKDDDAAVAVYEASSFAEAGIDGSFDLAGGSDIDFGQFCGFLLGPDRIAEGTVRRVSNLSNASFSVSWVGEITAVDDGSPVQLTEVYQLKADAREPGDSSQWRVNVSKILLSPRP